MNLPVPNAADPKRDVFAKVRRYGLHCLLEQRTERGGGLRRTDSWLEPAHAVQRNRAATRLLFRIVECLGKEDVRPFERGQFEIRREHADDGHRVAVYRDGPPERRRVAAEPAAPERVGDDRNRRSVQPLIRAGEFTTRGEAGPERPQEVGVHASTTKAQPDANRSGRSH